MDRREFLKYSGLMSAAGLAPELAFSANGSLPDKIVVLVELKGGNDGFNTLVPYKDPAYKKLRPNIRIREKGILTLGKDSMGVDLGMHPNLSGLHKIMNQGDMAWVQGVGYQGGVLSHFRSMDIWDSGSNANQFLSDGWLSQVVPRYKQGLHGICVSPDGSSLGPLDSGNMNSVSMQSPRMFVNQSRSIKDITPVNSTPALAHLTSTQNQLFSAGQQLREKMSRSLKQKSRSNAKGTFGHSLDSVAQMITAGIDCPVYKVTQDGFDMHSGQVGRHNNTLYHLNQGLTRFAHTMKQRGLWDRIVIMSYSEFGRRAKENRAGGTDHGTASSHFVMGGKVNSGLFGIHPNMEQLDANGNVAHTVDFRQMYATLAQRVWKQNNNPWRGHRMVPFV